MKIGTRVRALSDGQLGHIVETETGGIGVQLDRKAERRVMPFNPREWLPDTETRLQPMQIARVTYEADRALRLVLGEYGITDWVSLPEPTRLRWMRGLPEDANDLRAQMHRAILKVLAT